MMRRGALERDPCAHLHVAHGARIVEGSKVGILDIAMERTRVDVIEKVEHVGPNLQSD